MCKCTDCIRIYGQEARMRLSHYRIIDLTILTVIAVVLEFVNQMALIKLHTAFQISVMIVIVIMMMMRWRRDSLVPVVIVFLIKNSLILPTFSIQFLASDLSVLLVLPLIKIISSKEQVKAINLVGLMILTYILKSISYGMGHFIAQGNLISNVIVALSNNMFAYLISILIILVMWKQEVLLVYMPKYLETKDEGVKNA